MIKKYIYIGLSIAFVVTIISAFFVGKDYGSSKQIAKYETAVNDAIQQQQIKQIEQINIKNNKIKELNSVLQKQIKTIRQSTDKCLTTDVGSDIGELLKDERDRFK